MHMRLSKTPDPRSKQLSTVLENKINNRPKTLIISSLGPRPYLGGIENVIDTLISSNLSNFYRFTIFETYRSTDPGRRFYDKIAFALELPFKCAFNIIKIRPDLVHIHFCSKVDFWKHSICLLTSKVMGVKTIFHLHGGNFDTVYHGYHPILKALVRFLLARSDILIVLSEYWHSFLSNLVGGNRIRIVPNPINCDELSSFSRRGIECERHSVVLLGSLGKRKGHYDVLKAMPLVLARHSDTQVFFAGLDEDIGATAELKRLAKEYGIENSIHFLGPVSGEAKLKLLGEAGIVILPSYGENMPISVLEGMAAGKPIISTRVGAIPEVIVNKKSGLLIEPGDWRSLAENIILLFDTPKYAKLLGQKAYERVRDKWDVGKIVSIFDSTYRELLDAD